MCSVSSGHLNWVCGLPFKGPCDVTTDKTLWHVRGNSTSVLIGPAATCFLIKCAWQQQSQWETSDGRGPMFPAAGVLRHPPTHTHTHTHTHTQFLVSLPLCCCSWCWKRICPVLCKSFAAHVCTCQSYENTWRLNNLQYEEFLMRKRKIWRICFSIVHTSQGPGTTSKTSWSHSTFTLN